jgi:hypothetical protein
MRGERENQHVDGWTIAFLVVDAAGVIGCLVLAARAGRADGGLRRRIWLAEAAAYTGLFGLVWLANPAMTFGALSLFVPNAAVAGFALWIAMGLGGRSAGSGVGSGVGSGGGNWRAYAIAGVVLTWGILVFGVALGHQDKQQGITDRDRDAALLGQKIDDAHNHVPVRLLDQRPTVTDAGIDGASGERIERSSLSQGTLTMVVHAAANCEPAVVLLSPHGDTVDVLVVFQRSIFLSPLPSPSVAAADATGGLCQPPAPGNLLDSGFRSITMAVQIDLPSGLSASAVQDASQP